MPFVTTGLLNNGRTHFFNLQYADSLSPARGLALAADIMNSCDDDLSWLASCFSGQQLYKSPPILVSLTSVATDSSGNPTQYVGGQWLDVVGFPLQLTINIGELPMASGTPAMLARYLLVAEVSEMYMRSFGAYFFNPWYSTNEGNKGEALSRFLGVQFLLKAFPGIAAIPSLAISSGSFNVTRLWLNSPRINFLEYNDADNSPDPEVGCATLFLFFLHDQLGFRIEDIINAGAGHLSNVYENLTHDSWTNAWNRFHTLVDAHCPASVANQGGNPTSITYQPPLDTIFPFAELDYFAVPTEVTWVQSSTPNIMSMGLDHASQVDAPVMVTSSDATIIPAPSSPVMISPPSTTASTQFSVLPQPASFTAKSVLLTATYGGVSLTRTVIVVNPDSTGLPSLEIDVDRSADLCSPLFVENSSQTFVITNLNVFANQSGLVFSWVVSGAVPGALDSATLTIPSMPAAGTTVTVSVTVTNTQNIKASGTLKFITVQKPNDVVALQNELRCRLAGWRNGVLSIPPWVPIEKGGIPQEQIALLEKQLDRATQAATSVITLVRTMKEFGKTPEGRE